MIKVQRVEGCILPSPMRHTNGAAGIDLAANEYITIPPKSIRRIGTGFRFAIPEGWVGLIWPKSGLSTKGLDTRAGVIDADYRGEVKVLLRNETEACVKITKGQRIAQMVVQPVAPFQIIETDILDDTERGDGGFGSTGV